MSNTVHVKGISSETSEKEVRDFFSFCGKISNLSVTSEGSTQSATVAFEKETAAKTALLLDNTQLGPSQVSVSQGASTGESTTTKATSTETHDENSDDIAQEDKPRSRIIAEYLAHGYVIGDKGIERALALDQQHGVSNRFMTALTQFDSKYKATEKVQAADQKYGVSANVNAGWRGLSSYFEKAANTPSGQRVRAFYEQGQKQVLDVHNEARHLASLKAGKQPEHMFQGAAKPAGAAGTVPSAEEAEMEKVTVDGKEKTKCNCGGAEGKCPCTPGQCACSGCEKQKA